MNIYKLNVKKGKLNMNLLKQLLKKLKPLKPPQTKWLTLLLQL